MRRSSSYPPTFAGCRLRKTPASTIARMLAATTLRSRTQASAFSARTGAIAVIRRLISSLEGFICLCPRIDLVSAASKFVPRTRRTQVRPERRIAGPRTDRTDGARDLTISNAQTLRTNYRLLQYDLQGQANAALLLGVRGARLQRISRARKLLHELTRRRDFPCKRSYDASTRFRCRPRIFQLERQSAPDHPGDSHQAQTGGNTFLPANLLRR